MPHELTTLEREAIAAHIRSLLDAKAAPEDMRTFEFNLPGRPPLFVKQAHDILLEASTQHFFYLLSIEDESAPRIPRVFDAFLSTDHWSFMVTEKIDAPTLSECKDISDEEAVEYAARAVKWLLAQLPRVPDTCFGRIASESGCARHPFFKDCEAPRDFANPDDLAEWISKV